MKKGRFNEQQIIGILKQQEAGRKVPELAREHGVSEATIYTWKSKYGGMEVNEAQRLKALDDENRRLKTLVADLSLDKEILKAVIRKNVWSAVGLQPKTSMTGWFAQMYSAFEWASPGHDEKFARGCPI
jgi:putative transposase